MNGAVHVYQLQLIGESKNFILHDTIRLFLEIAGPGKSG